jgi:hypothetical protein
MDAAGVGKINTISQAVFEGMKVKTEEECRNFSDSGPWPGGCKCNVDDDCIISKSTCFFVYNKYNTYWLETSFLSKFANFLKKINANEISDIMLITA